MTVAHRGRIAEILRATQVFSEGEIEVALELFDEAVTSRGKAGDASPGRGQPMTLPRAPAQGDPLDAPPTTSDDYRFLGAFTKEDDLVGYACYGPTPSTDRAFDLYWIAVEPEVHGTGVGTFLLSEVERRLEQEHARLLVIETSSRSEYAPTRGFYEHRGYAVSAAVRDFYAPGDDRIILTKRFQSDSPTRRGASSP